MMSQLNTLFTMTIVCNRALEILTISSALKKHMPLLTAGTSLLAAFEFNRPSSIKTVEDIEQSHHALFLLISQDGSFALRGQMLCTPLDGEPRVIFVGSPWLTWLNTHRPELTLGLQDFSAADAQMDQLFYISTERQMVGDLETLNQELLAAKRAVETATEERNAFYTQMSHEMRTPLNGVVSALALLMDQQLSPHVRELVNMAHHSSDNLMQVINYVLDVARLENNSFVEKPENFDLPTVLESVLDIIRPNLMDKQLVLSTSIDCELPQQYFGHKEQLHQVLLNLVSNAVKFTDTGTIQIQVSKPQSANKNLRINVVDTGAGIAEHALTKIFEPFYTSTPYGRNLANAGTGLGLDIVKRNIECMNGELGVQSELNTGSTFWFEINLAPAKKLPSEVDTSDKSLTTQKALSGKIMLVEDNDTNRILCTMLLESLGLEVITHGTAEAAIAAINQTKPDVILMDIDLPGINGHEATETLRRLYSPQALPIIALTAYAHSAEKQKSAAAGMNDFLIKPVSATQFHSCLNRWLPSNKPSAPSKPPPILDTAILSNLEQQIGKENLRKVITHFCQEALAHMDSILSAKDVTPLSKSAHALVSTCDSFALPTLAEHFRQLEKNAKAGNMASEAERQSLCNLLLIGLKSLESHIN